MKNFFLKLLFTSKTRRLTWRKLSALLRQEISQRQALTMLRNRYIARKHPLARLFTSLLTETGEGRTLDQAFSPWISSEETLLIRSGVQSGKLSEAMRNCADLIEARTKIKQSIVEAFAYPAFLLSLLLTLTLVLAYQVIPQISLISNPETWTGTAGLLYKFCSFVASPFGLVTFILLVIFLGLSVGTLPFWTGRQRLRVENIPPWSIYRLVVGSVWLFTLATLLKAEIDLDFILKDMLTSGTMRPWLAERVKAIQKKYRSEGNFGSVLLHLGMKFPDTEMTEELAVFATLPNFEHSLYDLAKEWLDDGVARTKRQAGVLKNALICVIIFMVCCLGLSLGSIQQQLTNTTGGF
jgi:type II secretory pathway component PulF